MPKYLYDPNTEDPFSNPEKVREWEEKLANLKKLFIHTSETSRIIAQLNSIAHLGNPDSDTNEPAGVFVLTAESHAGKTKLLDFWISLFISQIRPEPTEQPVAYVEVPANASTRALADEILQSVGGNPLLQHQTEKALMNRAKGLFKSKKVRVLIIDEVQHLMNITSAKVLKMVENLVKSIVNKQMAIVILVGTNSAEKIIDKFDEQLYSRTDDNLRIEPFDFKESASREEYVGIVRDYMAQLPFEKESVLDESAIIALYVQCRGLLGRTIRLILSAVRIALVEEAECVTRAHLREAAERKRKHNRKDWFNAFDLTDEKIIERALEESKPQDAEIIAIEKERKRRQQKKVL